LTSFQVCSPGARLLDEGVSMHHTSARPWRAAHRAALGLAVALGIGLPSAPADADTTSAVPAAAPDGPWSVDRVTGGYQVTLHLKQPLPVRDALPELAVDGASVGTAHQSPDGCTLTVVTRDPAAADPSSVRLAWNGEVAGAATEPSAPRRGDPRHAGNRPAGRPGDEGPVRGHPRRLRLR
jgi:hypothetical protein